MKYLVIQNYFGRGGIIGLTTILLNTFRNVCDEEQALTLMETTKELPVETHDVVSEITYPENWAFVVKTCVRLS